MFVSNIYRVPGFLRTECNVAWAHQYGHEFIVGLEGNDASSVYQSV